MLREKSIKILEALAAFKYLNTWHLLRLKLANHRSNLNKPLKELLFHNMIWKQCFGVDPKQWRLNNFYYLKTKWKEFLCTNIWYSQEQILMPIWTSSIFIRDYFHRTNAIDFQIELYLYILKKWWKVLVFDRYFDHIWESKKGSLRAKTKLIFEDNSFFIPDAIIKLELDLKIKLFAFEIYNGLNTKRVLQQLHKHIISLQQWLVSISQNEKIGSRVLILFDSKVAMDAAVSRVSQDDIFIKFKNLFLFSYIDLIKFDFNSWQYFDQTRALL